MKFKVLCPEHSEKGKIYKKGSIIESTLPLDELFGVSRFERIADSPVVRKGVETTAPLPPLDDEEDMSKESDNEDVTEETDSSEFGEDVTAEFPLAKKVQVSVFAKTKGTATRYFVVDKAGNQKNSKPLLKNKVKGFLKELID